MSAELDEAIETAMEAIRSSNLLTTECPFSDSLEYVEGLISRLEGLRDELSHEALKAGAATAPKVRARFVGHVRSVKLNADRRDPRRRLVLSVRDEGGRRWPAGTVYRAIGCRTTSDVEIEVEA